MSEVKHECVVVEGKCTCTDNNHTHNEAGKTVCTDCGNERQQAHKCEVVENKCQCTDNNHEHKDGKTVCTDCGNERQAQH